MTCVQPRPDPNGRFVYHRGQVVRCGKPATWTCSTCDDPLCRDCAHDPRWRHMPAHLPSTTKPGRPRHH